MNTNNTGASIQPLHLFVLAGQSNMSGVAPIPLTQESSSQLFTWSNGGWQIAQEPIQATGMAGPGMGFGLGLIQLVGRGYQVGLIPCAVPGSSIEQWQRGQAIYDDCVSKTLAALATQPAGTKLSGVLFAQGESNTFTQAQADGWVNSALLFAGSFRIDTGELGVPFLYAQLGRDPQDNNHLYWSYLQNLQPQIMAETRPYIRMVSTKDLPVTGTHFADAETYTILGRRFAAIYFVNFSQ